MASISAHSCAQKPATRESLKISAVFAAILISVFSIAIASEGFSVLHLPQLYGLIASCVTPLAAAFVARQSPTAIRLLAPPLAVLIIGPPVGTSYLLSVYTALDMLATIYFALVITRAIKKARSNPSDHLSRILVGTAGLGTTVLMLVAFGAAPHRPVTPDYVIVCFAMLAITIPAIMGCLTAFVLITVERRIIPILIGWYNEARQCMQEQR